MRLKRLKVSGFRGFPQTQVFDLDADAVIVAGLNGSGKTSFFDAILWALSGSIPRLNAEPAHLVSKWSTSGDARVELILDSGSGSTLTVRRRFDGGTHLSVQVDSELPITGPAADAALIDLLWPDAKSAADPLRALNRSLTRATYLQQDSIREFVQADDEKDRFQVVGELVGAGRIAELQRQLESSRNVWARATTALSHELEPLVHQRQALQSRMTRISEVVENNDDGPRLQFWRRAVAEELGIEVPSSGPEISPEELDRSLKLLRVREAAEDRKLDSLRKLASHLDSPRPVLPEIGALEVAVLAGQEAARMASERLEVAQESAASLRRSQVERREQRDSLQALAQLALEHLEGACPVCGQEQDAQTTRLRLRTLIDVESEDPLSGGTTPPDISSAAAALEAADRDLAVARASLREGQELARERESWESDLRWLAGESGLSPDSLSADVVRERLTASESVIARLQRLRSDGDALSLGLARGAERMQRDELGRQAQLVNTEIANQESVLDLRKATSELASGVIEALRDANSSLVTEELQRIEPMLQRIYATVDPHPNFRVVSFLTGTHRGQGQLWTQLDDSLGDVSVSEPAFVLSSSQLNVLAVATYLALNLAIPTLPLQLVALDDPLQSLDTVNLLGLADLLRRVKTSRQVIVSTHDARLANLLERKLRPVSEEQRTVRIELGDWTSQGPRVEQGDVPRDAEGLRLVASA